MSKNKSGKKTGKPITDAGTMESAKQNHNSKKQGLGPNTKR